MAIRCLFMVLIPMSKKIFIIAGEASGDALGAAVLQSLKQQSNGPLQIQGIGGPLMQAAGLCRSLFPMDELSVMGIFEILPRIPHFIRRINETVAAITDFAPDVVISIDSPDFCFRVQKKLKKINCPSGLSRGPRDNMNNTGAPGLRRGPITQIHIVAPSVWAWRPGRAKKIAAFLDGLVCFFPFEPPYFERHGLRAISMGHPAIDGEVATADGAAFRTDLQLTPGTKLLGLYLGSRAGVIARHAPIYIAAVNKLAQHHPNLHVVIPTFPAHIHAVNTAARALTVPYDVIDDPVLKPAAMRACDAALAISGTVGLELAIADVPHVVGYRMGMITHAIAWMLIKRGQYAHLANIILGRKVVPEYIQGNCTPENLAHAVTSLLGAGDAVQSQRAAFVTVRQSIGEGAAQKPADKAAGFILGSI
jgi:lipid-A-disaccharide synthase